MYPPDDKKIYYYCCNIPYWEGGIHYSRNWGNTGTIENFQKDKIYNLTFVPDANHPFENTKHRYWVGCCDADDSDFVNSIDIDFVYYTVKNYESKTFQEIKAEIIEKMKTDEFVKEIEYDKEKEQFFIVHLYTCDIYDYQDEGNNSDSFVVNIIELNTNRHIKSAKR